LQKGYILIKKPSIKVFHFDDGPWWFRSKLIEVALT